MKTLRSARKQPVGRPFPPGGRPKTAEASALIASIFDEAAAAGKTRGEILISYLFALAMDKDKSIALRAIGEILDWISRLSTRVVPDIIIQAT